MRRNLVIGGSLDGEWMEFGDKHDVVERVVRTPLQLPSIPNDVWATTQLARKETYKRRIWRSADETRTIWGEINLTDIEIVDRLIRNYRPYDTSEGR